MKLITFMVNVDPRIGAVVGDTAVDLTATLAEAGQPIPNDMAAFLGLGEDVMKRARTAVQQFEKGDQHILTRPLDSVTLLAPIPRPPKIMMGGRNYLKHIDELREKTGEDIPIPPFPRIFSKYHTSVVGPGMPVIYPKLSKMLDFEGELTVVIGKPARRVSEEDAYAYIAGYTIVNDVTARDVQEKAELILSKNFETFAPMGPWIVTADEIPDPHILTVRTLINDQLVAQGNTSEMLFNIPQYVSFLSGIFPLEPGDIISTGSPPGPGRYQDPPLLPKVGDTMRIEIEKIGVLENTIVAAKD